MPNGSPDSKPSFAISFIHENYPEKAAKPSNLSRIRSHAALENHKRTREQRRVKLQVRQYFPLAKAVLNEDNDEEEVTAHFRRKSRQPQALLALEQHPDVSDETQFLNERSSPLGDPQARPETYQGDPFQTYDWTLSSTERFLLNHCKSPIPLSHIPLWPH
ncbi:hypothetical protein LIA77_07002 [Sarocladium implicatum]|nr:hypothetical protein LIA77_07002 [Sarocladium implicatum]